MESFPINTRFKKPWRSYQKRVLSDLEEKMKDKHLHIIAPPGSGKTILGLEVIRKINKPTIILAPTLAIRDQWIERFYDLFLEKDEDTSWISKDINNPGFLTVSTYQSLHSTMSGSTEIDENEEEALDLVEILPRAQEDNRADKLIEGLIDLGVQTLVVDEAHHLRSEWWKSLIFLKDRLDNPMIVALTATPPYDSSPAEWERYTSLCGDVDAEIFVPELVRSSDLCPHQDYIYFSAPSRPELDSIAVFRSQVKSFMEELLKDDEFALALTSHPCIISPGENMEAILENPAYYSSIAIFLKHRGDKGYEELLKIMGIKDERIPSLNYEWLETLLTNCLFKDTEGFKQYGHIIKRIRLLLGRVGAIERKKVNLMTTEAIKKLLLSSITKLDSIGQIVNIEVKSLGERLRMVILTDYIRGEEMPRSPEDLKPLSKIGVVPVFELLRRLNNPETKLGVLSGGLVIVPESSQKALFNIALQRGINSEKLVLNPLKQDKSYLTLELKGQDQQLTQIVTELFTMGEITVLVGTKSLLGEGWDAPCINSLILASFVGSYMLSNQMRGRAIRVWPGDANKTANIWHLVCIEPGQILGNNDLDLLSRRFKAFVGVSSNGLSIENGIERFELPPLPYTRKTIMDLNTRMAGEAMDRDSLRERWGAAVSSDASFMHEELRAPSELLPQKLLFKNTIKSLLLESIFISIAVFTGFMRTNTRGMSLRELLMFFLIASAISAVFALPKLLKALWLYIKHGPAEASMKQIGEALLKSLVNSGDIQTDSLKLRVRVEKGEFGSVLCSLLGGTTYEASIFIRSLKEILGPIDNPRYLLIRNSMLGIISQRDYHCVPSLLGNKEKNASFFHSMWQKLVGQSKLVYTRSAEGREILLQARVKSLSSVFVKRSERVSCWK